MSTPEKVRGQNTGCPIHFKKSGGMFPCPATNLRPWSFVCQQLPSRGGFKNRANQLKQTVDMDDTFYSKQHSEEPTKTRENETICKYRVTHGGK